MRLLIVSQYFWPESFRVNDLAAEMVRRGHDVTVLSGLPNYPDGRVFAEFRRDARRFAEYEGARIVRVPLAPRGTGRVRLVLNYLSFAAAGCTLGAWRLRGNSFDAIFVFQPSPVTSSLPALLIGRLKAAPVVLWVLDLWPDTLEALGVVRSPRALRVLGALVGFIYRRCALVLGQSRAFVPNLARYTGTPVRYFPGWAEPIFDGGLDGIEPAPELGGERSAFNVLFAGNIGDAQDFPAILDAAESLRGRLDVRWLIVGDGRAAGWVREEIRRRSLQGQVRMLGRYPIERMPSFFRGADALLVSLRPDPVFAMTIPGKVQAYLAAGLPVLGMLEGEGARVIEESEAGLVCPAGDGAALARRVEELAALPAEERARMGARGLRYARLEFDRDALIARLEGWLGEVSLRRAVPEPS